MGVIFMGVPRSGRGKVTVRETATAGGQAEAAEEYHPGRMARQARRAGVSVSRAWLAVLVATVTAGCDGETEPLSVARPPATPAPATDRVDIPPPPPPIFSLVVVDQ